MLAVEIVFPFFALAFQLASAQTACVIAQAVLLTDPTCAAAVSVSDGTDVGTIICMGSCRTLFDDVINNCDVATATTYSTLINDHCNGTNTSGVCENAIPSISPTCLASINSSNTTVCTGECKTQVMAVFTPCNNIDQQTQLTLSAYDALCGQGTVCIAALKVLYADTSCATALDNEDAEVLCSGSCRSLIDVLINTCPDKDDVITRTKAMLNRICAPVACTNAISGINLTCSEALDDGDYFVCFGTCKTEVEKAVNACNMTDGNDTQAEAFFDQYNVLCPSACLTAYSALEADTNCTMDDDAAFCSATCRTLVDAVMNVCPVNYTQAEAFLNPLCPSACIAAHSALEADISCTVDDDAAFCSATCRTLVDAVMNVCPVSDDNIPELNLICGSGGRSGGMMLIASRITLLLGVICVLTLL